MADQPNINSFSLICRLFGNLFYREPNDPILAGVFEWLKSQQLSQVWPLETDKDSQNALENLQIPIAIEALEQEYQKLFQHNAKVSLKVSDYGVDLAALEHFRELRNVPPAQNIDQIGLLLLTASWLEDNVDSSEAQREFLAEFLLPCAARFLPQVENHSSLPFYRSLAYLTREILAATADELEEN